MARQNSEEREFQRSVEVGEQNARLTSRIEAWCSHLKVELLNSGLYAQMTQLPIGRMGISCPYAQKGISAHDLKSVASYFVLNNCRGCAEHQEVLPENAGREILLEADKVIAERAEEEIAEKNTAEALQAEAEFPISASLDTGEVTEQSIVRFVAGLARGETAIEAAEALRQSAHLAPEFFSENACAMIAGYLSDIIRGNICAEILRTIARSRGGVPVSWAVAAERCIEGAFCHDEVLGLYADALTGGHPIPAMAVVAKIIGHQSYGADIFAYRTKPEHPGQEGALIAIGRQNLERLEDAFARRFENPEKHIRAGATATFRKILPVYPDLGPVLTDKLIESLSLDDDDWGISADVYATDALADIYLRNPRATQARLDAALISANTEVKKLIYRVHRSVVHVLREFRGAEALTAASSCVSYLFDVLIPACTSASLPLEVRDEVAKVIESLVNDFQRDAAKRADGILGALALVTREEFEFFEANKGGDPDLPGWPRVERHYFEAICHGLVESLKELAEFAPAPTWTALSAVLQSLPSSDRTNVALKARLLDLLVPLAKHYEIAPQIVPALYRALMELKVPMVVGKALEVIEELLRRNPDLVPDNMRAMVVVYLGDTYIYIHQSAARVMREMPITPPINREEVAERLLAHFRHYSKGKTNWRYCGEILDSLANVCHGDLNLQAQYLLLGAVIQCQDAEANYDARPGLGHLRRLSRQDARFACIYVREVLSYLTRFPNACHNFESFNDEHDHFLAFFDVPASAIEKNLEGFKKAIPSLAEWSIPAAYSFLSTLLHFEQFEIFAELARKIPLNKPPRANQKYVTDLCEIFASAAEAEAKVKAGDVAGARACLKGIEEMVKTYDESKNRDDVQSIGEALSLADRVAGRIE